MGDELTILRRVTADLDAAGIQYMVTGSIALAVYAEPRMTRDADLVIELAASDVDRFVDLFDSEFHCDRDRIREAAVLRDVRVLDAQPGLDWDYMTRWAGDLGLTALLEEVRP